MRERKTLNMKLHDFCCWDDHHFGNFIDIFSYMTPVCFCFQRCQKNLSIKNQQKYLRDMLGFFLFGIRFRSWYPRD